MNLNLADWATSVSKLPLAFSQVREDPRIDIAVMSGLDSPVRGALVASGGCTASACLGLTAIDHLELVDPNPSQLALTRLKIDLLTQTPRQARLELLGHAPLEADARLNQLRRVGDRVDIDIGLFGDLDDLGVRGPDHVGRYERVFEKLRENLGHTDIEIETRFNDRIEEIFAQDILATIFGNSATANRAQEFSSHFQERFRVAMSMPDPLSNPYLNQILNGFYGPIAVDWIDTEPLRDIIKPIYHHGTMVEVLEASSKKMNFVGLSNILDWLSPEEAQKTLYATAQALEPNGAVVIRQLNSNLPIRELTDRFYWDVPFSEGLHQGDRSFFYRDLHVGFLK